MRVMFTPSSAAISLQVKPSRNWAENVENALQKWALRFSMGRREDSMDRPEDLVRRCHAVAGSVDAMVRVGGGSGSD
jgi:hypothetical protein